MEQKHLLQKYYSSINYSPFVFYCDLKQMLHSIKAIVLRTTKYTDNSLIVNAYTDRFGLQSYIVRGVHSRTSKVKVNYFQGLTLLEMIVTKTEKTQLERINEVTGAYSLIIEFDHIKNAIALFLNELLYKTIREEESNPKLFGFLINAFEILGLKENKCANFHLVFMLQFAKYLGFYPTENYSGENKIFDLIEGRFLNKAPHHIHYAGETLSRFIYELMNIKFETSEQVKITNAERKQLVSIFLDYYKLHNALSSGLTSHLILEQL
ncbi:MAG: DNA repair protein RecO [Bacteroidia bacterium]|nr:DNA repair protein RecO [Bacteroidia bacterium]